MKQTLKSVRALAATLITLGSLAGGANAATLTFGNTELFPASGYTELGFIVTATTEFNAIFDAAGSGFSSHYFTYQGSTTTALIALISGGSFDFQSVDIGLGEFAGGSFTDITFLGTLAGGGTLTTTFTNVSAVQNVVLNWTGVTSVTVSGSDDPGFDNVSVTAVPEPSSAIVAGLGFLSLAARRRRLK